MYRFALLDFYLTGGVVHFAGVDEATVDHNPCRVGNDDVGFFTGDFYHALQVCGVLAAYLVDDELGFAFCQMRVTGDDSAGLGGSVFTRVIHDGTRRINVELAVAVHRDAGIVRRLDVYLRQAVGGL